MVLSGTALPGVSVPPVSGKTGLVLNPRQRPYVVPVELCWTGSGTWVRNMGQRCLSPTLSHPGFEALVFPDKTSSGRLARNSLVVTHVRSDSDKHSLKNLSVFGGLLDAIFKTSVVIFFNIFCFD